MPRARAGYCKLFSLRALQQFPRFYTSVSRLLHAFSSFSPCLFSLTLPLTPLLHTYTRLRYNFELATHTHTCRFWLACAACVAIYSYLCRRSSSAFRRRTRKWHRRCRIPAPRSSDKCADTRRCSRSLKTTRYVHYRQFVYVCAGTQRISLLLLFLLYICASGFIACNIRRRVASLGPKRVIAPAVRTGWVYLQVYIGRMRFKRNYSASRARLYKAFLSIYVGDRKEDVARAPVYGVNDKIKMFR